MIKGAALIITAQGISEFPQHNGQRGLMNIKDINNKDPKIRGLALRYLSQLKFPES